MQPLRYCITWEHKKDDKNHAEELKKQTWGVNKNPIYQEIIIRTTYHNKVMWTIWARETDDYVEYLRGNRPPRNGWRC